MSTHRPFPLAPEPADRDRQLESAISQAAADSPSQQPPGDRLLAAARAWLASQGVNEPGPITVDVETADGRMIRLSDPDGSGNGD